MDAALHPAGNDLPPGRQRALLGLALSGLAAVLLPILLGFRVDFASFIPVLILPATLAIFLPYLRLREMRTFYAAIEVTVMMILASLITLILTYCAMRLNLPLADGMLGKMDGALGFSTIGAIGLVNGFPTLNWILARSYESLLLQILVLPFAVCLFCGRRRAYEFIFAFIVLSTISIIVRIPFPSHGAIIGQGFDPASFSYISQSASRGFITSLDAVRGDPGFILSARNASGIVTFPSGHASAAVLCAWAVWPSRVLRMPMVLLNSLMFISTITCGSHYLVDVIAAGGIAMIATRLAALPKWSFGTGGWFPSFVSVTR